MGCVIEASFVTFLLLAFCSQKASHVISGLRISNIFDHSVIEIHGRVVMLCLPSTPCHCCYLGTRYYVQFHTEFTSIGSKCQKTKELSFVFLFFIKFSPSYLIVQKKMNVFNCLPVPLCACLFLTIKSPLGTSTAHSQIKCMGIVQKHGCNFQ